MWAALQVTGATTAVIGAPPPSEAGKPPPDPMEPINSRINVGLGRRMPEYFPTPTAAPAGHGGASPSAAHVAPAPKPLSAPPSGVLDNAYLQPVDARGDGSRNVARELRGAVTDDTAGWYETQAKRLAARQLGGDIWGDTATWAPPGGAGGT
jgi:hypothetical protein